MAGTRERIVTATAELFRRQGFHETSVKDVTAAAGVTMGSLYHFFPDGKEQLAAEVLRTTGAVYLELWEAIAGAAADVAGAVRAFFDGAAEVLVATDYVDICPIGSIAREVASSSEALRIVSAEVFASWERALASLLGEAGLSMVEARSLALTVIATLEGGFVLSRAARDPLPLHAAGEAMERLVRSALGSVRGRRMAR